ncbi:hypothetical protein LCGC14_2554860, partial [marine sediment metagenome]
MRHFSAVLLVIALLTFISPVMLLGQGDASVKVAKVVVEGNKKMSLPAVLAHINT